MWFQAALPPHPLTQKWELFDPWCSCSLRLLSWCQKVTSLHALAMLSERPTSADPAQVGLPSKEGGITLFWVFFPLPDQGSPLSRGPFQLRGSRVGLRRIRLWFASGRQSSLLLCDVLLHPEGYSPGTGKSDGGTEIPCSLRDGQDGGARGVTG